MLRFRRSLLLTFVIVSIGSSLHADFKKAYFKKTTPGSWADYRSDDGATDRCTRLPDADGKVRVLIRSEFSRTKYPETPPSLTQYTLDPKFPFERNAISYGHFATDELGAAEGNKAEPLDRDALKYVHSLSPDYSAVATFKATETLAGKTVDHYTYRAPTEWGDLWLRDGVPFGLVRKSASTKDASGAVVHFVVELTGSGSSGSNAVALDGPASSGSGVQAADSALDKATTVDGKLIVNGKSLKLTHAYAIAAPTDQPGQKFYHLIFSDVAISDKDLALFPDVLLKAINQGTLHAIRVGLDNEGAVDSTDIFDASGWTTIKEENKIDLKTFNEETVAGRLHLEKPYRDIGGTTDYDLRFSIPVRQESELNP